MKQRSYLSAWLRATFLYNIHYWWWIIWVGYLIFATKISPQDSPELKGRIYLLSTFLYVMIFDNCVRANREARQIKGSMPYLLKAMKDERIALRRYKTTRKDGGVSSCSNDYLKEVIEARKEYWRGPHGDNYGISQACIIIRDLQEEGESTTLPLIFKVGRAWKKGTTLAAEYVISDYQYTVPALFLDVKEARNVAISLVHSYLTDIGKPLTWIVNLPIQVDHVGRMGEIVELTIRVDREIKQSLVDKIKSQDIPLCFR